MSAAESACRWHLYGGVLGILFVRLIFPLLNQLFAKMHAKYWNVLLYIGNGLYACKPDCFRCRCYTMEKKARP